MFIVIEGCDAAGKNTQTQLLADSLRAAFPNKKVRTISFPRYETTVGKAILRHLHKKIQVTEEHIRDSSDHNIDGTRYSMRAPEDALVFQCLMLADKVAAASEITSALHDQEIVICDRYWPSAYAYGGSEGLDDEWLVDLNKILPQPTHCILLDLDVETATERATERARAGGKKKDRYETLEFQRGVMERYDKLWDSQGKWIRVDANGTKEDVAIRVRDAVVDRDCLYDVWGCVRALEGDQRERAEAMVKRLSHDLFWLASPKPLKFFANVMNDGSLLIESTVGRRRLAVCLEKDAHESSWHFVSLQQENKEASHGLLPEMDLPALLRRLVGDARDG